MTAQPDPRPRLDEIKTRADAATEGPWAPWLDQDGAKHMHGMLMVGNEAGVIPDGEVFIEGVDVNPVAHTYTHEDREFIAHARTDLPAMAAALTAVLELHWCDTDGKCRGCHDDQGYYPPYPCPTVRAITDALGGDRG